ncbi:MAG: bifunctional demethylmenaquinone methyltransferase/2-methoxy-6-polyprenyl-1,4-benzoquinol methylase UbiE [Bacteroidota bacterium]|nr:bifunctional demethylmenaquinone methyltransferase/2-methoxy-6-polyprenyl-1,4-benzoquinol methylase UbiE [Bacteroidota bacterium]
MIQEEKKNIGSLFDSIAKKYDFLNHLLSFNIDKKWRKKATKLLLPCNKLLDVATGTGDFAIEILKQKKAKQITGIDLSKEMIAIGEKKLANLSMTSFIDLRREDVSNLNFSDNSFEAITCGFGVRNFSNLEKGLSEMFRVLQPNGQVVILEFSYPKNPIIKFFYNLYFTFVLPLIGKLISKDKQAYKYLPLSVKNFAQRETFLEYMQQAGFQQTTNRSLTFGICTLYSGRKN